MKRIPRLLVPLARGVASPGGRTTFPLPRPSRAAERLGCSSRGAASKARSKVASKMNEARSKMDQADSQVNEADSKVNGADSNVNAADSKVSDSALEASEAGPQASAARMHATSDRGPQASLVSSLPAAEADESETTDAEACCDVDISMRSDRLFRVLSPHHRDNSKPQPSPVRVDATRGLKLQIGRFQAGFDNIFLRDSCTCHQCVNPHSGQKRFQTAEIPDNIAITAVSRQDDTVLINWRNDIPRFTDHRTTLSVPFLLASKKLSSEMGSTPQIWTKSMMSGIRVGPHYDEYMENDEVFFSTLRGLRKTGLVILDGVPDSETAVRDLANKIGLLRRTFYGDTWDVKDKPNAENVAYTAEHLGMHMDLLYMKQPPGLQLLHCLKSSCEGGESMFVDSFWAAQRLFVEDPPSYESLATFPVNYKYDKSGHFYTDSKLTIDFFPNYKVAKKFGKAEPKDIWNVNWSPPFQGTFTHDIGVTDRKNSLRGYHKAAQKFAALVDDPANQFIHRLEPGQCVIFNNRRILHGRRAFQSGQGERWFKGAYVDTEDFESTYVAARARHKARTPEDEEVVPSPQGEEVVPST